MRVKVSEDTSREEIVRLSGENELLLGYKRKIRPRDLYPKRKINVGLVIFPIAVL